MNQRHLFIVSAIAALFLLCCACSMLGILAASDIIKVSESVSCFNLLVDIFVGIFTVWGLFWAASEFAQSAVKPVLHLLPGRQEKAQKPDYSSFTAKEFPLMREPPFLLPGWYGWAGTQSPERDPYVECGLYLENETSRAGRYVRLVMHVLADPPPS